jgi:predicted acyltransferase
VIYGINPLVAFVGSGMMARTIYSLWRVEYGGREIAIQSAIHQQFFASWLAPKDASFAFALSFVMLWMLILWVLARRGIVVKV